MIKQVLAAAILCATGYVFAEDFYVDAPVSAAVLYRDMAEVTRQIEVEVAEVGHHRIVVANALQGAVQPVVHGATLIGVSSRHASDADVTRIQQALDVNKQQINIHQRMMQALADSLSDGAELAEVQQQLADLQKVYAELLTKQMALQDELKSAETQAKQNMLVFDVDVATAGTVNLSWQTRTDKAHWQPVSDWYLHTDNSQLDIRAYANVVQDTGMDWQNTALTLAILPPEYVYPPEWTAQEVRAVDPEQFDRPMPMSMRKERAVSLMAVSLDAAPAAPAEVQRSGVDFRVALTGRYDVPSGQHGHSVTYWQGSTDAKVYSAIYGWSWPENTPLLSAEWKMPEDIHVLVGKMTLYRDGNMVTQMQEQMLMPAGSKQSLSFGVDPQLRVTQHNPPDYTESHGVLRKSSSLSQRVTLNMDNQGTQNKVVRVYARLPVSTEEDVTVKPVWSPKPTQQNVESVQGLTLWEKTLAPQETWAVQTGFDVSYPEGKQLVGI